MFLSISDQTVLVLLLIISLSATTIIISLFVCIASNRRRRKTPLRTVLTEIDILNALKDSKVFPVEYSNGWKLHDYVNGQQVWSHDLQLSAASPPPSSSLPAAAAAADQKQQRTDAATVFACFSKVKGSPQMVLNILKDIQKHDHWTLHPRPLLLPPPPESSSSSSSKGHSTTATPVVTGSSATRQVAPSSSSVCHDVISVQTTDQSSNSSSSSDSSSVFGRLLKRLSLKMLPVGRRSNPSTQVATIQRFWQREENGCCWLLEYESEEWNFCLMQPIEGWFETDRCLLTLLSSRGETDDHQQNIQRQTQTHTQGQRQMESHCLRMAVKVCSVRDYLHHRRIQTIPLVRLSLSYPETSSTDPAMTSDGVTSGGGGGGGGGGGLLMTSPDNWRGSRESKSSSSLKDPSQDVSLLQKFKNMIELKRESYEVEKRRKAARAMSLAALPSSSSSVPPSSRQDVGPASSTSSSSIQSPFDLLRKLSPSKSFDQGRGGGGTGVGGVGGVGGGGKVDPGETKRLAEQVKEPRKEISENGGKEETERQQQIGSAPSRNDTLRRRMPLLNEIGRSKSVKSASDISRETEELSEKVVEKEAEKKKKESSSEDIITVPNKESSVPLPSKDSELESRLKLIAEATVADLIAEKGRVSQLNITSSYKEQAKATGGWTYRGLEKDTVILQKEIDDEHPVHSYLGKGMVPASPKLVYEILRKPHNRKTYDNWLQKVQVLHEFESGLKIVYMYHEGKQLSKKTCHDLCLLQSEKCEGKRYIISLQSVEWPKCKELENVARVKMSSSGWLIEPVVKGKDVFSMITYITQMELGSKEVSSDYLDEFAAKQPVAIIALRQYVTTLNEAAMSSTDNINSDCPPKPLQSLGRNDSPSTAL